MTLFVSGRAGSNAATCPDLFRGTSGSPEVCPGGVCDDAHQVDVAVLAQLAARDEPVEPNLGGVADLQDPVERFFEKPRVGLSVAAVPGLGPEAVRVVGHAGLSVAASRP